MTPSKTTFGAPAADAVVCLLASFALFIFWSMVAFLAGDLNHGVGSFWLLFVAVPLALLVFCLRTAHSEKTRVRSGMATAAALICIVCAIFPIEINADGHAAFPFLTFATFAAATAFASLYFRQWLFLAGWAAYLVWFTFPIFRSPGQPLPRMAAQDQVAVHLIGLDKSASEPTAKLVFRIEGVDAQQLRWLGPRSIHLRTELGPGIPIARGACRSEDSLLHTATQEGKETFVTDISTQPWMRVVDVTIGFPISAGKGADGKEIMHQGRFRFERVPISHT